MSRQARLILASVGTVLLACPALCAGIFTITTLAGGSTYTLGDEQGTLPQGYAVLFCLVSLVLIAIIGGLWWFFTRAPRVGPGGPPPTY